MCEFSSSVHLLESNRTAMRLDLHKVIIFVLSITSYGEASFNKIGGCPVVSNERCDSKYVQFFLNTRSAIDEFVSVHEDGTNNLTSSHFDSTKPSIIVVHGYADSRKLYSLQNISKEYLKREELNVWFLDWSALTPESCYLTSVYNLDHVGRCLGSFIRVALDSPSSGLHVVGFSLGGHAAALAANHLKPYLIPRITGLDPALPLFVGIGSQRRLSPDDGVLVDVIHTNAFLQGNFLPLGDVDFFVNGGVRQPGCGNIFKSIECSHERAPIYFAESINSALGFWGWTCRGYFDAIRGTCRPEGSFHLMGAHLSNSSRGLIYVKTNDKEPFAMGKPSTTLDAFKYWKSQPSSDADQ